MGLTENYKKILNEINFLNKNTKLIAVSKTKPVEDIRTIYNCGQRDFGENKVQELLYKYDLLPNDIRWHFIGHLQTNKVKDIIDKVELIHSVDSIRLAEKINIEADKKGIIVKILVQINLSKDENKFGIDIKDLYPFLEYISKLKNIKIKGLMLIPKINLTERELNELFKEFSLLKLDINSKNIDNVNIECLSFGMSDDFKIAIKNGSDMVRVGSSIFGKR